MTNLSLFSNYPSLSENSADLKSRLLSIGSELIAVANSMEPASTPTENDKDLIVVKKSLLRRQIQLNSAFEEELNLLEKNGERYIYEQDPEDNELMLELSSAKFISLYAAFVYGETIIQKMEKDEELRFTINNEYIKKAIEKTNSFTPDDMRHRITTNNRPYVQRYLDKAYDPWRQIASNSGRHGRVREMTLSDYLFITSPFPAFGKIFTEE